MRDIYPELLEADIIIIGSPVYGCNVSSLLKAFLDRLVCLEEDSLKGKVGGVVCTANIYGISSAEFYMINALNYQGIILPGNCTCEGKTTAEYGSILKDTNAIKSAKSLAESITALSKKLFL